MRKIPKFAILLLIFTSLYSKKVHELEIYELKEVFNNSEFEIYKESKNGITKLEYKVGGKPVSKQNYDALLAEAKKIDWAAKRDRKNAAKLKISKKIYAKELECLKSSIEKLKTEDLSDYYAFEQATFVNENELNRLINSALPELENLLRRPDCELDINLMNGISEKLEIYNQKFRLFIQNSINNAINLCDDTKKLKKLMNLIDNQF